MFIIYFLGASIINTFAGSHFDFFQFLPAIGKFMIAMAMAAIGLNTNLVKLIKTGGKPDPARSYLLVLHSGCQPGNAASA